MHPEPWPPVEIDAKSLSQTVVANSFSGFLFTWSWQRPRGSSLSSTNSSSSSSCTPLCSLSRLCTICVPVHGHLLLPSYLVCPLDVHQSIADQRHSPTLLSCNFCSLCSLALGLLRVRLDCSRILRPFAPFLPLGLPSCLCSPCHTRTSST